jgi:hypothetical protein
MTFKRLSHSRHEYSSNFHLETVFPSRSKCAYNDQRSFTGTELRLAKDESVHIEELLGHFQRDREHPWGS